MTGLQKQRGVAAVELGILIIPLMLIAFGITEFGRAFFQYNALVKGTRDAARFLSAVGPLDSADPALNVFRAQAKCMVRYGNVDCSGALRVPLLTADMITICDLWLCPDTHRDWPPPGGVLQLVTVTVSGYVFTPLAPFVMPSSLTFNPISTTMRL